MSRATRRLLLYMAAALVFAFLFDVVFHVIVGRPPKGDTYAMFLAVFALMRTFEED